MLCKIYKFNKHTDEIRKKICLKIEINILVLTDKFEF